MVFWIFLAKFSLLQPLMNFRLPKPEDEVDYYGSSSQDETRSNQGTNFCWFYGTTFVTNCDTLSEFLTVSINGW